MEVLQTPPEHQEENKCEKFQRTNPNTPPLKMLRKTVLLDLLVMHAILAELSHAVVSI